MRQHFVALLCWLHGITVARWSNLITVGAAYGALRTWAAKRRALRDKEARLMFDRHQRASESAWPGESDLPTEQRTVAFGRRSPPRSPPWQRAPIPPAPAWERRARRSAHHRLQAVVADASKRQRHADARRRERRAIRVDDSAPAPADRRARANEAMAARARGDLLKRVLRSSPAGSTGRNGRSSYKGRQVEEDLRERVAALHNQWRELDNRTWEGVGKDWVGAPPPPSSVLRAAAWWRWRRALWGGLRDEVLDDLCNRQRRRACMSAWHRHTELILERRKQAAAIARPRLSKLGRKRVWFDRFALRAAMSSAAATLVRQRILARFAISRWARQTANAVLRRQIWREACVHHSCLLRKQSISAWKDFVQLRAVNRSRDVQARILGEAAFWRWAWKRWQRTQSARKLLRKVFGQAEQRRELLDAARGSAEWCVESRCRIASSPCPLDLVCYSR